MRRITPAFRTLVLLGAIPLLATFALGLSLQGCATVGGAKPTTTTTVPAWSPQSGRGWRLDPQPAAVALGKSSGSPLPESEIRAALLFSGVEERALPGWTSHILTQANRMKPELDRLADPAARAEKILVLMHDSILKKYSALQTRIDITLANGEYNCVSSAVLYMIFARMAGLSVSGVKTDDHVLCAVRVQGRSIDVETTSRYGFDPGTKKEFHDAFTRTTGYAYVSQKNYAGRVAVGEKDFLALILYNRVAELDRKDDFLSAIGLGADYYAVVRDRPALDFLFVRIGNAVGALSDGGRYAEALDLATEARRRYGGAPALDRAAVIALDNWLVDLGREKQWARGVDLILANSAFGARDTRMNDFIRAATWNQILELSRAGDIDAARRLLDSRVASGLIAMTGRREYDELIGRTVYNSVLDGVSYQRGISDLSMPEVRKAVSRERIDSAFDLIASEEARRIAAVKSNYEAWQFLNSATLPAGSGSERQKSVYFSLAAFDEHHRFTSFFNAKAYREARNSVVAALRRFPGNAALLHDLELVDKQLSAK